MKLSIKDTLIDSVKYTSRYPELLLMLCCLTTGLYFIVLRGQDINWDLLSYHYFQGYSLLQLRFPVDLAPAHLQSFLNPLPNVFSYLFLRYLPYPFSAFFILLIQLISIPAIILLTREINIGLGYGKSVGWIIPPFLLTMLAPLWISELGTTFFSSWTAPLILWGVYFIYKVREDHNGLVGGALVSGVLFGAAAGLKLTNGPFAIAALLMLIYLTYGQGLRNVIHALMYFMAGCSLGFGISAGWYVYLWAEWGSPLFPLYNKIFKSDFYDLSNFRDMRWHFSSAIDFLKFLVESFNGTKKTSELQFADARYLILSTALVAALFSSARGLNRQLKGLIIFVLSGLFLWATLFAYQRYLIPIELLLGLVIWILGSTVIKQKWISLCVIWIAIAISIFMLKFPDWGHTPMPFGKLNPFSVQMDKRLAASPGRYLVVGRPISYLLPFFHSDSLFYGPGFSLQMDDLIYQTLRIKSDLPLRGLAKDEDESLLIESFKKAGFNSSEQALKCDYLNSVVGRYMVCEVF